MTRPAAWILAALAVTSMLVGLVDQPDYNSSNTNFTDTHFSSKNLADIWATPGGGTGADMAWDLVIDGQGNSFVTGSFTGSATFGTTTLNSQGGLDGFVAKMDATGNWVWASQIMGSYDDWGLGIDLDPQGNIYVTGPFMDSQSTTSPSVTLGSYTLSAHSQSTYDMFIGKLDSNGNFQWATTSKKVELLNENTWQYEEQMGQVIPTDIKVFNNSVSVSGSYAGKTWAHTDSQGDWYYESTSGTSDAWVGFLELTGAWSSVGAWGGISQFDSAQSIASSPTGDYWYIAGNFADSVEFPGGTTLSSSGGSQDVYIMQITDGGDVMWVTSAGGTGKDSIRNIVADSQDSVYGVGEFDGVLASYGTDRLTANSGGTDVWAGKMSSGGSWIWAKKGGGPSEDMGFSLALSADESALFTAGQIAGQSTFENSATTRMANTSGASDAFVAVSSTATGEWEDVFVAGGPSGGDRAWAIATDTQNVTYTAGRFKGTISGPAEFGSDELASAGDFDIFVWKGLIEDDDDDRIANEDDDCPDVWGNATIEPYIGCLDTDGDGYADVDDSHPLEPSQWRDTDGDGFGDNSNGFEADNCTTIFGNSTVDRIGCEDSDGDGWSNVRDAFPTEFTQWNDSDGDLFGDNWNDDELTPNFGTLDLGQYVQGAVRMDLCPTLFGLDTLDNPGCPDTDLDGWSDVTDEFPNNPTQHEDSDGDGWGDNYSAGSTQSDYLPDDETQYQDRDGDGWGDDSEGNNPDEFPDDETQHTDIDDDGWGDNISGNNPDSCPDTWGDSWRDRFGCPDVDGDGTSDEGDTFPSDWSQWTDSDADGRGDNWANPHWNETRLPHWPGEYIPGATNSDKHPLDKDGDGWEDENASGQQPWDDCVDEPGDSWQDRFGCPDRDGDGWSDDNDAFDDDVTQWRDSDRDGFGDETGGINGDDCPTVRGDSENDRIGCPDTDTDGWSDPMDNLAPYPWNASQGADLFPADPARWNKTHEISESNSQAGDGGLAAGLGLGALIALMFVMVFAILIVKLRQNEEDDYYDDEDEDETEAISRAADIARSWQDHGVAPPPPPDGAELVTAASEVLENTQGTLDNSHQSYVAPPPPTAANTLDNPSGHFQDGDSIPQVIPAAPAPPDSPMSNDGGVMSGMDTNLAMSLLGSSSGGEETKSPDEVEEPVSEVGESGGDVSESRSEAEKAESEVSESALTPTASESVDNSADETQNQPAETAETWADDDDPWA